MKISVIIPIYNVAEYLPNTIDSILHQTYDKLEIILIDDGSTDISGKICDQYANSFSNITVIHQTNQGISTARNNGYLASHGDYISFIDGDDILHPKMYEELLRLLSLNNEIDFAMVYGEKTANKSIDFNSKQIKSEEIFISKKVFFNHLYEDSGENSFQYHVVWNKLFKRSLIDGISFEDILNEDTLFMHKVLLKSHSIAINTNKYYYWIQRNTSLTHNNNFYFNTKVIKTYEKCIEATPSNELEIINTCRAKLIRKCITIREFGEGNTQIIKTTLKKHRKAFLLSAYPLFPKIGIISFSFFPFLFHLFTLFLNRK